MHCSVHVHVLSTLINSWFTKKNLCPGCLYSLDWMDWTGLSLIETVLIKQLTDNRYHGSSPCLSISCFLGFWGVFCWVLGGWRSPYTLNELQPCSFTHCHRWLSFDICFNQGWLVQHPQGFIATFLFKYACTFDLSEIEEKCINQLWSNSRQRWRKPAAALVKFTVCIQLFWSVPSSPPSVQSSPMNKNTLMPMAVAACM